MPLQQKRWKQKEEKNRYKIKKKATGENSNPFLQVEETAAPIISDKATVDITELKETILYNIIAQYSYYNAPPKSKDL